MKFLKYVKDNLIGIFIYLVTAILITLMLAAFKTPSAALIITFLLFNLSGILILTISYLRKNKFYKLFLNNLEKLDKKFLILETLPEPTTYEEKIMVNSLYEINKSMIENIKISQKNINDFKEFVEVWIHEVKINFKCNF